MKNIYTRVAFIIVCTFTVMILMSFVDGYLHDFLGDWFCDGSGNLIVGAHRYERCNHAPSTYHVPGWHWGYRHWMFFFCGVSLFILNLVRTISVIIDHAEN